MFYLNRICIHIAAILLLAGCMNQPVKESNDQPTVQSAEFSDNRPPSQKDNGGNRTTERRQNKTEPSTVEMTYLNSHVFDQGIASNMNVENRTIHVNFPVRFTLNSVPDRIDKWLSKIVDNDGKVEIEAKKESDSNTRSFTTIASLVRLAVSVYDKATEGDLYEASERYNGKITYDPTSGEIIEIVLYPRNMGE